MSKAARVPALQLQPLARVGQWTRRLLMLAPLAATSLALAHATIVFGTVTTEPAPAKVGEPMLLRLEMRDPSDAPVEDAVVLAEARPMISDAEAIEPAVADSEVRSASLREVAPGRYETTLVLDGAREWTVELRDQTFPQEEARATVSLRLGPDGDEEPLSFLFPPAATAPARLSTWLVWLIALPLVAGLVVTVMVMRGGGDAEPDEGRAT
jgi:hypothetical protein